MEIRLANAADIPELGRLLLQVHDVHAKGRPDLFAPGARKYDDAELEELLRDDEVWIFVADEGDGHLSGHAFCRFEHHAGVHGWQDVDSLHIDDICVDEAVRGQGIATTLYQHVLAFAREKGFYNVTLNVWDCNPGARAFYEAMGMNCYRAGMEYIL